MAFGIAISFPGGRFHATPWGHHVNEGLPEWPPSPWRLLRALVAVWKRKLHSEAVVSEHIEEVIAKLAAPPVFKLPPATLGHTRHYMPWFKNWPKVKQGDRTKVFDAFVALVPDAEVVFVWPEVTLDQDEERAVDLVLSHLNYFGRAESWCSARVCSEWESLPGRLCGRIDAETGEVIDGAETENAEPVRVLAPDPQKWKTWSYGKKAVRPDPPWNLLAETADLHRERWSDPPGSRWLTYMRPSDAFAVEPAARRRSTGSRRRPEHVEGRRRVPARPATVVRFALDGTVLPLLTETVYLAETARRYVQGIFGKLFDGASSPAFSGKSADGSPLAGHHHAFFLPTDEDGDGRLDHLTIIADMGFSPERELVALDRFRKMHGPGGTELGVLLLGVGEREDFSAPVISEAKKWRSVTPFIPTRHHKRRGRKRDTCGPEEFAEVALREEMARRGLPEPVAVRRMRRCELWDHQKRKAAPGRSLPWLQFRRERLRGSGRRGTHPGCGFQIEFPEPVRGPLALGYGCHFGLGMFVPEGD